MRGEFAIEGDELPFERHLVRRESRGSASGSQSVRSHAFIGGG